MKILYISGGEGPDYLCDMLFHGLRSMYGADTVDINRLSYMYKADYPEGTQIKRELYGKGFSVYGLLGDDSSVDRDDILSKIQNRFFTFVIYGSIRRCADFLHDVVQCYDKNSIVFVDGEDDQSVVSHLVGRGLYFKREMMSPFPNGYPIQFAIPEEKISQRPISKLKDMATVDPRDRTTYIFDSEADYYHDYASSLFGFTQKKAGWDCLRHYEIMANRCIPFFDDLENCPLWTMPFLPKFEIIEASRMLAKHGPQIFRDGDGRGTWDNLESRIFASLNRDMTTRALARYVTRTVTRTMTSKHTPSDLS